jgi:hypothetical protein
MDNIFESILKQTLKEATPTPEDSPDPNAKPAAAQTTPQETDNTITGYNDKEAVEKAVEDEESKNEKDDRGETRLLGIDKRDMNKQFAELCKNPVGALPIKAVSQIISNFDYKLVDDSGNDVTFQFKGPDGNFEFDIEEKNSGRLVTNSIAVLQYHKNENETYNFNFYFT